LDFFLKLLQQNNSSCNLYSDAFYLHSLIRSLGNIELSPTESKKSIVDALTRCLQRDTFMPSHRHLVTQAVLETYCSLEINRQLGRPGQLALDYDEFLRASRPRGVRLTAFRCYCRLLPLHPRYLLRVLNVLFYEPNVGIRGDMARIWADVFLTTRLDLKPFRERTSLTQQFMDTLWYVLNAAADVKLRMHVCRLYHILWGSYTPLVALRHQRAFDEQVYRVYRPRVAASAKHSSSKHSRRGSRASASSSTQEVGLNIQRYDTSRYQLKQDKDKRRAGVKVKAGKLVFKLGKKKGTIHGVREKVNIVEEEEAFAGV
jgi:hypothetical protein